MRLMPFRLWRKSAPGNLILPLYHTISDAHLPHLKYLYRVRTAEQFREDLEFLLRHFKPAGITELKRVIRGEKLAQPHFLVSFDDGLHEVYDVVAPVLIQQGLTAMVFINPSFVGNQDMMFRLKASALAESAKSDSLKVPYDQRDRLDGQHPWNEYLSKHRPYMDMEQLQALQQQGFIIGAHSMDHPPYSRVPLNAQVQQTRDSISYVSTHFKPELELFAFPFTDDGVTRTFFNEVAHEVDATFGSAGLKRDSAPYHFQRIPMEDYNGSAASILRFEFAMAGLRKLIGRNTIKR